MTASERMLDISSSRIYAAALDDLSRQKSISAMGNSLVDIAWI